MNLSNLAEYGITGICIATLILLGWTIKKCLCLSGNHIQHNTEIQTKLVEKIKQDIDLGKETLQVLRALNHRK